MSLLWTTNISSPFRMDFFDELGEFCELTVLFEKAGALGHNSAWLELAKGGQEHRVARQ